jgi:iron(III) transport system ATP-binding protein
MASIHIDNVTVGYGQTDIVSDCQLRIEDGSLFTLLGPSGCGKTTLLRTLAGFVPVRKGQVRFGERDVTHLAAHLRDVGMVFQDYALFPDKSVFDNVAYGLRARKADAASIARSVGEYLERVGLSGLGDRLPAALSGGQRQRVALARALVIKPAVLLMDEPLSNLDAKLRLQVRETIRDLQREVGITTVLVTHDQEEALAMSDRIGLMRGGRLEQVASPRDLYDAPVSAYAADFVGAANVLPVTVTQLEAGDGKVGVLMEDQPLMAGVTSGLSLGAASLLARPETLALQTQASDNCLAVTVRQHQFLGARSLSRVQTRQGRDILVESQGGESLDMPVGSTAYLWFDPKRSRVVSA